MTRGDVLRLLDELMHETRGRRRANTSDGNRKFNEVLNDVLQARLEREAMIESMTDDR